MYSPPPGVLRTVLAGQCSVYGVMIQIINKIVRAVRVKTVISIIGAGKPAPLAGSSLLLCS